MLKKKYPLFDYHPDLEIVKRKQQKQLRLRVRHGKITISAPYFCSKSVIHQFMRENYDWIQRTLREQKGSRQQLEELMTEKSDQVLLYGDWKQLRCEGTGTHASGLMIRAADDAIYYSLPVGEQYSAEIIKKIVNVWMKEVAKTEIRNRFYKVTANMPFTYNRVFIRSQKTKWGTCSSKGNLSFNWRIIKSPHWIWDYLFVHEICHTQQMNHSKAFWKLVDTFYPRRKEAEKWLKENGTLIFADSE